MNSADPNVAYVAAGIKNSSADQLSGREDCVVVTPGWQVQRIQVAQVPHRQIAQLPRTSEPAKLSLRDFDLDRVLEVDSSEKKAGRQRRKPLDDDWAAVAYALTHPDVGCPTLIELFGPMGTKRAQRARDFARRIQAAWQKAGFTYPLLS